MSDTTIDVRLTVYELSLLIDGVNYWLTIAKHPEGRRTWRDLKNKLIHARRKLDLSSI